MFPNALPSERAAIVGTIKPDAATAGPYVTGWVNAGLWLSMLAVILAGDLGSSATVNAKIEQAKDADGTDYKDVTGKAITPLTQAGSDSNKQSLINLRPEDLDVDNGYGFVRLTLTVGTATSDVAAVLLGFDPRFGPASDFNTTSVDEIVD